MPSTKQIKTERAVNPRFDAIQGIVKNRLQEQSTVEGQTVQESMEDQGMIINEDPLGLPEEILDSDTGESLVGAKDVMVDLADDVFEPEAKAAAEAPEAKAAAEAPEAKAAAESPEAKAADPEAIPEPEKDIGGMYERDGEMFTKIKVDGELEEVSMKELKASAQKDRASFARFQQVAEKEQDLERREAALAAAEQARSEQIVIDEGPDEPTPQSATSEDVIDELYDAFAYEDEDTVKAKLAALVTGQAQTKGAAGRDNVSTQSEQPVDIKAEVNAALEARALQDWEAARKAAVASWEIEYDDIAGDPALRDIANTQSKKIALANPGQSLEQTLRDSGDFARKWAGLENDTTLVVDIDSKSRKAAKRSTQAPVRTNGNTANRQVKEDKPQTRSEVIAGIRAGRGQAAA